MEARVAPIRCVKFGGLRECGLYLGNAGAGELIALLGGREILKQQDEIGFVFIALEVKAARAGNTDLRGQLAIPSEFKRVGAECCGDGAGARVE